jgi:hypothetical protein
VTTFSKGQKKNSLEKKMVADYHQIDLKAKIRLIQNNNSFIFNRIAYAGKFDFKI